jgi:hypothetical protein
MTPRTQPLKSNAVITVNRKLIHAPGLVSKALNRGVLVRHGSQGDTPPGGIPGIGE